MNRASENFGAITKGLTIVSSESQKEKKNNGVLKKIFEEIIAENPQAQQKEKTLQFKKLKEPQTG